MENREKEKDFLKFQVTRKVTNLYKNFLFILEDLQDEDYNVSDESYKRSRKRVLDHGNDSIREIEECLKDLDIRLK